METNTLLHLKHKIESLLFSAARRLSLLEIKKITNSTEEDILKCLHNYKKELEEKGSSIQLLQEGETWQLSVQDKYIPIIKKVVTQTEMPKTIIETLAVIAYKAPVLQSNIIKIRTNKAYFHIDWLETEGFITREKKGRTKLIRVTPKFYDYFSIDPKQAKELFESITNKETKNKEEIKIYKTESQKKEIQLPKNIVPYTDNLGQLELYDEKDKQQKKVKHKEKTELKLEESSEEKKKKEQRLKITPEQDKKADERVKEMLGIKKEEKEIEKEEKEKIEQKEEKETEIIEKKEEKNE